MERRRWVAEILRKGTNSVSWLVGGGVKEREECMSRLPSLSGWRSGGSSP